MASAENDRYDESERVKARPWQLRCPDVVVGTWLVAMALGAGATATTRSRPVPPPAKNAVFLAPAMNVPRFAVTLGYDRAVHRRVSVGARFEYAVPKRGYAHLQGWAEGVALSIWAPRAFHGFFAQLDTMITHTVLSAVPGLHSVGVAPGATVGLRWRFGTRVFVGASGGLRWGIAARRNPAICTLSAACPAIRKGPAARVAIEVGVAF
jgi:hypothetical protein